MSDNEVDYNASVVMVDPNDIEMASDEDDEAADELTIDCDYDNDNENDQSEEMYDPMSLVSVGLEEDDDDDEEETIIDTSGKEICEFCQESFDDKKKLSKHIKSAHPKSCQIACQYCGRVLSDAESYRRHLNNMHQISLPSSPLPPQKKTIKTSPSKPQSRPPQSKSQPQPVFSIPSNVRKCPDCDQQFATKTTLNIHRLKVHVAGLKNLPCPQCHGEFPDLTSHMRRAHNVDGIVCPHCANIFSKKCTLNRHIEQVHLNIQIHKPATCPECHKVFSKKGHLDRHIKIIHQGIKDYSDPCPYCKKVFTTRASLEPHIAMVHEGVRKKCTICNKVLSDLNKHMRTVHGTYRRKAKIPKDLISEIDNPESDILPQIYGTSSKNSPDKVVTTLQSNIPEILQQPIIPKAVTITPTKRKTPTKSLSKNNNIKLENDNVTQSIKEELGLSSGITLQKIVRPMKGPPKLTYHGPRVDSQPTLNQFGSIEITPMNSTDDGSDSNNCIIPRLAFLKPENNPSSSMIKISGKNSRKMPELVQLKKVVQKT